MNESEFDAASRESPPEPESAGEPCIYQYLDYRAFLKDRYRWLQSREPGFSQRKLARVAGFANPGFFNEVIQGRRKLSPTAIQRMGVGLSLEATETEFLGAMVAYTEAKDMADKEVAHQKLEFRRNRRFFRRLSQSQSKYYLDFNYPLVRAAIEACDFRGDYQILGDFLRPPLQAATVKRYVRDLCDWGLVTQDRDGRYRVTHSYLEPPDEMKDALVRLQQAWLTQSVHLLNTIPASERHASSALLTVGENTYKAILKVVEKMREEILELVRSDTSSERIVQFNVQVFPRGGGKRIRTLPPVLGKPAAVAQTAMRGDATRVPSPIPARGQSGPGTYPKPGGVTNTHSPDWGKAGPHSGFPGGPAEKA